MVVWRLAMGLLAGQVVVPGNSEVLGVPGAKEAMAALQIPIHLMRRGAVAALVALAATVRPAWAVMVDPASAIQLRDRR